MVGGSGAVWSSQLLDPLHVARRSRRGAAGAAARPGRPAAGAAARAAPGRAGRRPSRPCRAAALVGSARQPVAQRDVGRRGRTGGPPGCGRTPRCGVAAGPGRPRRSVRQSTPPARRRGVDQQRRRATTSATTRASRSSSASPWTPADRDLERDERDHARGASAQPPRRRRVTGPAPSGRRLVVDRVQAPRAPRAGPRPSGGRRSGPRGRASAKRSTARRVDVRPGRAPAA